MHMISLDCVVFEDLAFHVACLLDVWEHVARVQSMIILGRCGKTGHKQSDTNHTQVSEGREGTNKIVLEITVI